MTRHFRIHPAIGTARMGNSSEHFIGPESPGVPANWDENLQKFKSFRDAQGQVLRQGARFRVFEYDQDKDGTLSNPREVALGNGIVDIEWRVHLANRKASFYVFNGLDGAEDNFVKRSKRPANKKIKSDPDRPNLRNVDVPADKRTELLDIDPGEQVVSGNKPGPVELLNLKPHIPIRSLGTLVRDEGRLIVLGGYGESNSSAVPPKQIDEYASNDTWFDDASDGSVKARIVMKDGTTFDADPAWVLVGPPDFAPPVGNVVRLLDTLWDTAVRELQSPRGKPATPMAQMIAEQKRVWQANHGKSLKGYKPSFVREIYPMLKRALATRDVHVSGIGNENYHRASMFNWKRLSAANSPLADGAGDLRKAIFHRMRDPDSTKVSWDAMPRGLGDDATAIYEDESKPSPRSFLSLTRIQYALLREWANGNFIDDMPDQEPSIIVNAIPSPDDLDIAAAENSVGGPFFPGIEVSWLVRVAKLFTEPFRLKIKPNPEGDKNQPSPFKIGALEFRAGFFSQQMALPWQADFYDCHKEEHDDKDGNQYYFMWWTAQRPDDVFPPGGAAQKRWVKLLDGDKTPEEADALENLDRYVQMQQRWHQLKFIAVRNGDHFEEEP